ncbi:MAG: type I restriction-modification system subunit M [Anaerolineae bacterium]|nr:type I restriction-modification system subunit M [Anaerolineae bacterium]
MPRNQKKPNTTLTTAQRLSSIVKSCRDIMRKDKGLNGDLDRLPMLTWIMFLKFFDDMETEREVEAQLEGKPFYPIIEPPYRWRNYTDGLHSMTGEELLAFINNDEAVRPGGTRGLGLFAYLRGLRGDGQRDVLARVFQGVQNRFTSGYLLRDVIDKINDIHFTSNEEIFTLSHLYESLLREMRDAAGDSGEFYTPRTVVRFIVEVINPELGEILLDPACGTGGFLVAAYEHLYQQVQSVEDRRILQNESLLGGEAKSLPYLLAQMNLLLHGLEAPNIDYGNSLRHKLSEIGERDRVDIILTNPPFGGEEERGIQGNFPADKQTSETALLFLQLIMRKLKRQPKPGRAGVVVPNGTLFADGVAARIKEELLKDFNLHTIVRLPNGVFAPYTSIPTNLLFFDRSHSTRDIWYYEITLPAGKKNYTKTQPMQYEEFADCIAWWNNRIANDHAWKVRAEDVLKYNGNNNLQSVNLDISNPNRTADLQHRSPEELVESILAKEHRIAEIMEEIRQMVGRK